LEGVYKNMPYRRRIRRESLAARRTEIENDSNLTGAAGENLVYPADCPGYFYLLKRMEQDVVARTSAYYRCCCRPGGKRI